MAGSNNTDTSREAAESMEGSAAYLRKKTYQAICCAGDKGLTADEAAAKIGETPLSIRPRVTELKQRGYIVDSGKRRQNKSGRKAAVFIKGDKK